MYLISGSGTLTTALCPSCPAILPSGTSIPKQHRSNRFVHTLHTASSQDGHDVHRSSVISFRYRQSPNRIQTQRMCSNPSKYSERVSCIHLYLPFARHTTPASLQPLRVSLPKELWWILTREVLWRSPDLAWMPC